MKFDIASDVCEWTLEWKHRFYLDTQSFVSILSNESAAYEFVVEFWMFQIAL